MGESDDNVRTEAGAHLPSDAHAAQSWCLSTGLGLQRPQATGQSRSIVCMSLSQWPRFARASQCVSCPSAS